MPPRAAAEAVGEKSGHASFLVRAVTRAVRGSIRQVSRLDWSSVRRGIRVALVSLGLVALFGATYLGARGYLGLPSLIGGRGTLVVESQPSGAELYVDGFPSGQTPATLELRAGEHTLALRAGKRTTLVPVVVVSGARRVERVEIRQRRATAREAAVARWRPAGSDAGRRAALELSRDREVTSEAVHRGDAPGRRTHHPPYRSANSAVAQNPKKNASQPA